MSDNDLMASSFGTSRWLTPGQLGEEVSDALLLDRFIEQWDQKAFRDLVCRHGPMVLGVCRRILRDAHAAEDAFQATFLLLVRKAGSVRKRGSVGPWLYGTARRVALEARNATSRRRAPAHSDLEPSEMTTPDNLERDELHAALHEELGRLPEKYRTPLMLCYIEGLPHGVIAQQLGWPLGTVRVRIARGRDFLGAKLTRRGLTPAAVLLALSLLPKTAVATPVRLIDATVRTAARVIAGEQMPRGEIPTRVVDLERKVRKAMHLTRLKWAATCALMLVATGAGLAALVPSALAAIDDAAKLGPELKKLQGTWLCAAFEQEGVRKEGKGGEEQIEIKDETFSILHGGHVEEKGTIKLDPSKNPREISFQIEEGKHQGKTNLAIYAWDGTNLKVCWIENGDKHPADFVTKPGDQRVLLILKRQD